MRQKQYRTLGRAAQHTRANAADDKRRTAIDTTAKQAFGLFGRDLLAVKQIAHRYGTCGIAAHPTDQQC